MSPLKAARRVLGRPRALSLTMGLAVLAAGGLSLGLVLAAKGPSDSRPPFGPGVHGGPSSASPPSTATTAPARPPVSVVAPSSPPAGASTAATAPSTATTAPTSTTPRTPAAPVVTTPAVAPVPRPFGRLTCRPLYGVRFCQGGQVDGHDLRVPSFDGVPLDADVTLPATGKGPFPLLVLLHGWGEDKTAFEAHADDGGLDNVTMASKGWAVLTYTARGFGDSCGTQSSRRTTPSCKRGWIRLADQRYEIRDTDYLAGLLVDEDIAKPSFAVAGVSYGAGQALELAVLKDRMVLPDGRYVALTSPKRHIPMSVAATFAQWPWDDLASALVPNGNLSSTAATPAAADLDPVGVGKQSWLSLLYGAGAANFLAPPGADPQANLTTWYHEFEAGEPYTRVERRALAIMQTHKSAIGIPLPPGGPAPTAIESGWNDSLFPASEAMHFANRLVAAGDRPPYLIVADVGHGWAQNKATEVTATTDRAISFLDDVVLDHRPPPTGVVALPTSCSAGAPSVPVTTTATLGSLAPGKVTLAGAGAQPVTSAGGNPDTAAALNPAYAGQPLCHPLPAAKEPGTAVYTRPVGLDPLTLLGAPSVKATIRVQGRFPELVARLWDVSGSTRQIVAVGVLRPSVHQEPRTPAGATATQTARFELPPNYYTFAAGHSIELELVGSTAPWFRKSNGTFTITVTHLEAALPVR